MTDRAKRQGEKFANPTLYIDPETSIRIAQLRKIYQDQGRDFTSFAQVAKDALFHYWQHMISIHGTPTDYEHLIR